MDADEKAAWQARVEALGRDWIAAAEAGVAPDSDEAQALAKRHVEWLTGIPGTPAARRAETSRRTSSGSERCTSPTRASAANYGGQDGAEFVRDALRVYAEANL